MGRAGGLGERVVLLNLVEQQHIFARRFRILAQRVNAHAAREFRCQLLFGQLGLVERIGQVGDVIGIHPHLNSFGCAIPDGALNKITFRNCVPSAAKAA